MPFGLLPGMRILVRYVVPQRRKYFKSTILTNFEVLNYEPKVIFETANLYVINKQIVLFFFSCCFKAHRGWLRGKLGQRVQ